MIEITCKIFFTCIIFTIVACIVEDASGGHWRAKAVAGALFLIDFVLIIVMLLMAVWL